MTNEEILKRAMEKAVGNGYDAVYQREALASVEQNRPFTDYQLQFAMSGIIYSHDFARAFFGEDEPKLFIAHGFLPDNLPEVITPGEIIVFKGELPSMSGIKESWQYHLQQMVVSEDPIKYIESFL